jgi:hypothetical protein
MRRKSRLPLSQPIGARAGRDALLDQPHRFEREHRRRCGVGLRLQELSLVGARAALPSTSRSALSAASLDAASTTGSGGAGQEAAVPA